ncbi:E3 ubiquitin-protein ligase MBR2-like [Bidens hawaiensis]|uniref:E3 ubiquitin-protein ligase MBR2-like n=1 Tax=Bidens hawaiensis TaxID=980011 RepID=UPI0040497289
MQGQRSIFDPFPETVDLNQGSNSNNNSMDETDDWNNMISPMERRLLNNDLSNELNFSCVNTNRPNNFQSFRSWDAGESSSSSRASLHDRASNDGQNWSNTAAYASRLEHQQRHESSTSHQGNMQSSVSNHNPTNVNLNMGYESTSDDDGTGPSDYGPGSSLDNWGLSCKRKTLEGTSTQSLMGGSSGSGCFPESYRSLNISPNHVNPVHMNRHEIPNTRTGVSERSQTPPPFSIRSSLLNLNNSDNASLSGNPSRRSNINSSHQSLNRQILLNEFLDHSRGQTGNLSNQQPPLVHAPDFSRNTHYFPWGNSNNNNIGSRSGSSSGLLRNNVQYHNFVPPSESRNLVQDPTNWSLATGSGGGGASSSSSRNVGGNGGSRSFSGLWAPQLNSHTPPSQQRPSELPPWTLFPSAEVESGAQRGHTSFPAGLSSSDDNRISSGVSGRRHHYQPFSRAALLMEVPGDDWRALAADIEGRQRLVSEIRQVLNAMPRGENLRAEDYMLFDPFINGVAELHDRHRDMRLDVDNMSYEELLALEERIGDVNTGLSEEVILKSMKQRKHMTFMAVSPPNLEPCCICQVRIRFISRFFLYWADYVITLLNNSICYLSTLI